MWYKTQEKISTFFVVESNTITEVVDPENGATYVITGRVIAKLVNDENMTTLFNRHAVDHPSLPKNKFKVGFIVANIGNSLDNLPVKATSGVMKLGLVVASAGL